MGAYRDKSGDKPKRVGVFGVTRIQRDTEQAFSSGPLADFFSKFVDINDIWSESRKFKAVDVQKGSKAVLYQQSTAFCDKNCQGTRFIPACTFLLRVRQDAISSFEWSTHLLQGYLAHMKQPPPLGPP